MKKRPVSVTIVGWLFIVVGVVSFIFHVSNIKSLHPFPKDAPWILGVAALALIAGTFMLRGHNWARWLAIAWLAFHVILSAFHSVQQTLVHTLLLAAIGYFLFRRQATTYFRETSAGL